MVNVFPNGYDIDEDRVRTIVDSTLEQHGITGNYEVTVNFISEAEMQKLYDKEAHDVLSFPLDKELGPDEVTRLGDIVVLGNLSEQKQNELIAHSCLHLLGIHHK